jgi:hypothetical protein
VPKGGKTQCDGAPNSERAACHNDYTRGTHDVARCTVA